MVVARAPDAVVSGDSPVDQGKDEDVCARLKPSMIGFAHTIPAAATKSESARGHEAKKKKKGDSFSCYYVLAGAEGREARAYELLHSTEKTIFAHKKNKAAAKKRLERAKVCYNRDKDATEADGKSADGEDATEDTEEARARLLVAQLKSGGIPIVPAQVFQEFMDSENLRSQLSSILGPWWARNREVSRVACRGDARREPCRLGQTSHTFRGSHRSSPSR